MDSWCAARGASDDQGNIQGTRRQGRRGLRKCPGSAVDGSAGRASLVARAPLERLRGVPEGERSPPAPCVPSATRYTRRVMQHHLQELADALVLGAFLETLRARHGRYELVDHWTQGEFHHDVVVRVPDGVFVVATNCNGGVKEVLAFESVPDRWALWHWRCPHVADFSGDLPPILGHAITPHWFDPCDLLRADARSELREEYRERQRGGGWKMADEPRGCRAARKP